MSYETRIHRLKWLREDWRGSARMKLMLERDSNSTPGRKGWEGGETKATWKGKPTNNLKRRHRLKESKGFTRVGRILDYWLRLREEKGGRVGKENNWGLNLQRWRGSSQLDEKCTRCKELRNNDRNTNCVILRKIWKGREVVQNTYIKIPHQSDEGAEE